VQRIRVLGLLATLCTCLVFAQSQPETVLLWPQGAPGAQGTADEDKPSLTIYPATGADKAPVAVVVCPGGSYHNLAMDHEGKQVAEWLNGLGISAFVLKYRLGPKYHFPIELWDAQRAIRYVRAHAREFGVQSNRVGIWGFSAGGHLASTTGTHFDMGDRDAADPADRPNSRPSFMILAYPVITMEAPYVHLGSRDNLLGEKPDPALAASLSNQTQVTSETPPTFLFATSDDDVVPVQNSIEFYAALRKAGVPAEMHIYLHGPHGVGLAPTDPVLRTWPDRLADWMKLQGIISATAGTK
jgi:acetyl esterase/lipase